MWLHLTKVMLLWSSQQWISWVQDRLMIFVVYQVESIRCCGSPSSSMRDDFLLLQDKTVIDVAEKEGKTPAQVLLQWGLRHGTSVIPEGKSASHQKVSCTAFCFSSCCQHFSGCVFKSMLESVASLFHGRVSGGKLLWQALCFCTSLHTAQTAQIAMP